MQTYSGVAAKRGKDVKPAMESLMPILQEMPFDAALSATVLYGSQYVMSPDPAKGIEWRQPKSKELAFTELSEPTKLEQQSKTLPKDIFEKVHHYHKMHWEHTQTSWPIVFCQNKTLRFNELATLVRIIAFRL